MPLPLANARDQAPAVGLEPTTLKLHVLRTGSQSIVLHRILEREDSCLFPKSSLTIDAVKSSLSGCSIVESFTASVGARIISPELLLDNLFP